MSDKPRCSVLATLQIMDRKIEVTLQPKEFRKKKRKISRYKRSDSVVTIYRLPSWWVATPQQFTRSALELKSIYDESVRSSATNAPYPLAYITSEPKQPQAYSTLRQFFVRTSIESTAMKVFPPELVMLIESYSWRWVEFTVKLNARRERVERIGWGGFGMLTDFVGEEICVNSNSVVDMLTIGYDWVAPIPSHAHPTYVMRIELPTPSSTRYAEYVGSRESLWSIRVFVMGHRARMDGALSAQDRNRIEFGSTTAVCLTRSAIDDACIASIDVGIRVMTADGDDNTSHIGLPAFLKAANSSLVRQNGTTLAIPYNAKQNCQTAVARSLTSAAFCFPSEHI